MRAQIFGLTAEAPIYKLMGKLPILYNQNLFNLFVETAPLSRLHGSFDFTNMSVAFLAFSLVSAARTLNSAHIGLLRVDEAING